MEKKDLIAVDEQATELAWFENPTRERHVLATDVPRPLNAACWDIAARTRTSAIASGPRKN
jgi:hypothetical protein